MGSPSGVDGAADLQESGTLLVLLRIENHRAIGTVVPRAGVSGLNRCRTGEKLRSGGEVERVKPLEVIAIGIFGHGDNVDRVARAIDNRRRSDSDFRRDLAAASTVAGGFAGK